MKKKSLFKLIVLIISLLIAVYLIASGKINEFISSLNDIGIIGVFIAGAFYGYSFTAFPAVAILIIFAKTINPLIVAFIGAIGTMCGDYLIFHIIKDELPTKAEKFLKLIGVEKLRNLKNTKYHWIFLLITAIIIASPLPDEIGVSLLGFSKYDSEKFLLLAFTFNFIGLLIITGIVWLL